MLYATSERVRCTLPGFLMSWIVGGTFTLELYGASLWHHHFSTVYATVSVEVINRHAENKIKRISTKKSFPSMKLFHCCSSANASMAWHELMKLPNLACCQKNHNTSLTPLFVGALWHIVTGSLSIHPSNQAGISNRMSDWILKLNEMVIRSDYQARTYQASWTYTD